jgi:hypothetical protein
MEAASNTAVLRRATTWSPSRSATLRPRAGRHGIIGIWLSVSFGVSVITNLPSVPSLSGVEVLEFRCGGRSERCSAPGRDADERALGRDLAGSDCRRARRSGRDGQRLDRWALADRFAAAGDMRARGRQRLRISKRGEERGRWDSNAPFTSVIAYEWSGQRADRFAMGSPRSFAPRSTTRDADLQELLREGSRLEPATFGILRNRP